MARPRKTGFDYFPCDTTFDGEITALRAAHGNDALAVWLTALQAMYRTPGGVIDVSTAIRRLALVSAAMVDEETWRAVVRDAVELGLFDAEAWAQGRLASRGVEKRIRAIEVERERARRRKAPNLNENEFSGGKPPENTGENSGKTPEKWGVLFPISSFSLEEGGVGGETSPAHPPPDSPPEPPPDPRPDPSVVDPLDETARASRAIFAAYPLQDNQQAALRAIRAAVGRLMTSGERTEAEAFAYLLDRTRAFAAIVNAADPKERQFVMAPARWYDEERYTDSDDAIRRRFKVATVPTAGAADVAAFREFGLMTRDEQKAEVQREKARTGQADRRVWDTYDLPPGVTVNGDPFLVRLRISPAPTPPPSVATLRPAPQIRTLTA